MKESIDNILLIDSNVNGIVRLTLNDLDNKNALSELMMQKLINAITKASEDKSVKVVVIASTGNVFCSVIIKPPAFPEVRVLFCGTCPIDR